MSGARNSICTDIRESRGERTLLQSEYNCKEKTDLLAAYQRAIDTYTAAVVELVSLCDHQLDHKKFRLIAELADGASSNAKERLERHVAEHK